MAEINIKFTHALPVLGASIENAKPTLVEDITSSGTSQATSITAPNDDCMVCVESIGSGDVWVKIGASPTAAVGSDHAIAAGQVRYFAGVSAGDAVAVIDDS